MKKYDYPLLPFPFITGAYVNKIRADATSEMGAQVLPFPFITGAYVNLAYMNWMIVTNM